MRKGDRPVPARLRVTNYELRIPRYGIPATAVRAPVAAFQRRTAPSRPPVARRRDGRPGGAGSQAMVVMAPAWPTAAGRALVGNRAARERQSQTWGRQRDS